MHVALYILLAIILTPILFAIVTIITLSFLGGMMSKRTGGDRE